MLWLIVALCLAVPALGLLLSALLVLLTPLPDDPWRRLPVPPEGEYMRAPDGAELFMRRWLPGGEVHQVILGLHGIGQHSGYHRRAGEGLASAGIAYYALDLRGNGLTRTPHGDLPGKAQVYADISAVVAQIRRRHAGARVYVLGHSLGGAIAACWAAETQPDVDGLLLLAPGMTAETAPMPVSNWLKGPAAWFCFRHRAVLGIGETGYAAERLEGRILPEEAQRIAGDPLHLQAMSMAFAMTVGRMRPAATALAGRVRVPTLVLVGEQDPARVGAHRFYAGLTVAEKRWVLMEIDHLLFHIRETPAVLEAVVDWLRTHN